MSDQHRHLGGILFTDIVGYTSMMQRDELQAVTITKHYNLVLKQCVTAHSGEVLNDYGDGSLCVFSSTIQALLCAIDMQKQLQTDPPVPLRIGLHIGEIFFEEGKVLGDGVNIASRIQSLGQANTILFSKEIMDQIKNRPEFKTVSLGYFEFKNVDSPIEVFALANDGLVVPKREKMEGKLKTHESKKKISSRKKWIALSSLIIILIIGTVFIYNNSKNKQGFTGKEKSIAVLPFKNMSDNKENEYFSNGITEDIITQLSKIADLKVISSTSSMQFKDTKKTLKQIAKELNVASFLEGSVQRVGNNVRINAQLIDANTDKHIWAEKYDRSLDNIFAIQIEVAQQIANQLRASLTKEEKISIEKKPTDNLEAYDLLLKGNFSMNSYSMEGLDNAESFYKLAIEKDSSFHEAYSSLARLYIMSITWAGNLPPGVGKKKAMSILNKVLAGGDTSSTDFATLYDCEVFANKNFKKGEYYLKRSLSQNPNDFFSNFSYAQLLKYTGRNEEAEEQLNKLRTLAPLNFFEYLERGENYYAWGKYQRAVEVLKEGINLFPSQNIFYNHLSRAYLATKQYEEATQILKTGLNRSVNRPPSMLAYLAVAYFKLNEKSKSNELINELQQQSKQAEARGEKGIDVYMAQYYSAIDNKEEAFRFLDRAVLANDVELVWLKEEPLFNNLRSDPRYNDYLKKAGFD